MATAPAPLVTSSRRKLHAQRLARWCANVVGAASAAVFAYSFLRYWVETHQFVGVLFFAQQAFVAVAYLVRRPPRVATRRLADWVLAFAGTFVGVLFRPAGEHPAWGIWAGTALQVVDVVCVMACVVSLGRLFGFAAADRGVVTRGAYAVVRHPDLRLVRPARNRLSAAEPVAAQRGHPRGQHALQCGPGSRRRTPVPPQRPVLRLPPRCSSTLTRQLFALTRPPAAAHLR